MTSETYTDETAYTVDNLQSLCDANDVAPDISDDEAQRLVELAQQRAESRGEESALDADTKEVLIATTWNGYASDNFGYDDNLLNKFALGELNVDVSAGKRATLFNNTVVVQQGWLQSGDSRRTKLRHYEDDDYDGGDVGDLWVANGAAEYIAMFELSSELIHGQTQLADAV